MIITQEAYDKMTSYKASDDSIITDWLEDFKVEHKDQPNVVILTLLGAIINPNMLKGFLLAWKMCSLQAQTNEVEQLNRMVGL